MHITEFLERAAPTPTRPIDTQHVLAQTRRPRWFTRRWVWITGLIALGGAGVPAAVNLAPESSPAGQRVAVVQPQPDAGTTTHDSLADGQPRTSRIAASSGSGTPIDSADAAPDSGVGSTFESTPMAPRQAPPTAQDASYPPAMSCSLDSVALAAGMSRTCQFTAAVAGGWVYDDSAGGAGFDFPSATLIVTHSGIQTTYHSEEPATCADAIISPGDQVQLTLTAPTRELPVTYRTGAGQGWDCTHEAGSQHTTP
jgi:hypothetical protein